MARKVSDLWQVFHGLRVVGTATKVHGGWSCHLTTGAYVALAADIEHAVAVIHDARKELAHAR